MKIIRGEQGEIDRFVVYDSPLVKHVQRPVSLPAAPRRTHRTFRRSAASSAVAVLYGVIELAPIESRVPLTDAEATIVEDAMLPGAQLMRMLRVMRDGGKVLDAAPVPADDRMVWDPATNRIRSWRDAAQWIETYLQERP